MNSMNCHCKNPCKLLSYAQYGVQSSSSSGSELPLFSLFQEGQQISLSATKIALEPGFLYLVNFIFLATPEPDSYVQITPVIDGSLKSMYSFFAPTGSAARNASTSGSFTLPVSGSSSTLSFSAAYPDTVRNIDLSGSVSVTALRKINRLKSK